MTKVNRITAWSYSRLHAWEECARRAKYKFIDKLEEPKGPALIEGIRTHKDAENYVTTDIVLPASLSKMREDFDTLKRCEPLVEQQWAFNDRWEPTGWFDRDAWLRVICDAVAISDTEATVIDHKTGKLRAGYHEQVELFSLAVFARYPAVKIAHTELWFLDYGEIVHNEFKHSQEKSLRTKWERRARRMLLDTEFKPNPGWQCKYCHFAKSKGGPCEFG